MVNEFPEALDDNDEYSEWVRLLATEAIRAARGQAADAEYTGDLADTPESRIEGEVERETDDKLDVLRNERTPYDVLRYSERHPSHGILQTLTPERTVGENAHQLAIDALFQDVLEVAAETVKPE